MWEVHLDFVVRWWHVSLIFLGLPLVYIVFREESGGIKFHLDTWLVLAGCWGISLGTLLIKLFP